MSQSRFNSSLPPKSLSLTSVLGAATLAAGLVVGASAFIPANAASLGSFTFSGTNSGGTASATMDFDYLAGDILNVTLKNTSDPAQAFDPAITALGFDGTATGYSSWSLKAYDSTGVLQTIGSSAGNAGCSSGKCNWDLAFKSGQNGNFKLDYTAGTTPGSTVKGGLYNPAAIGGSGFAAGPNFFTEAVLSIDFSGTFTPDFSASDSPYLKFQNMGAGGDGSLQVGGTPTQPIPEPASMLGIMAFGALGGGKLLKRRKQKTAEV